MDAVDQIYAAAAAPRIKVHSIGDNTLFRLSRAIRDVDRTAQEEGIGELIGPRLSIAKAIRFVLSASPLPGASPHLRLAVAAKKLALTENELRFRSSERIVQLFSQIRPEIETLSRQTTSALNEKFLSVWRTRDARKGRFAIVVPDSKAKVPTDSWLHEIEGGTHLKVLTPAALRAGEFYDELFLFGAPRWYIKNAGDFLFTTPRSSRLSIFGYRWTDLNLNIEPLFHRRVPSANGSGERSPEATPSQQGINAHVEESGADPTVADSEPPFELPAVDVQAIMRSRRTSSLPIDAYEEEIEARLILLAGGDAVLLPYSDDAKSFSADVDERAVNAANEDDEDEDSATVRRVLNKQLEVGDFILLRTGGGGDLLPVVADSLMGEKLAAQRRADQKRWKDALRAYERRFGMDELCRQLGAAGGLRANLTNVRNWMRERNLRPAADADFSAILSIAGLAGDAPRYFLTADQLNSVHHSAGNEIRRKLIAEVKKTDLDVLRSSGKMTFHLEGVAAGATMTAYRIERIPPDIVMARAHEVNDVFEQKDTPWQ